jgi:hypothetical protein
VIERLDAVPDGVIGLRASGKLTKDDYVSVLEPALNEALADGDARVLFVLSDFDGLEQGAWVEDVKTGLHAEFKNRSKWKRLALVTDVGWISRSMRMFAWLAPGEVEVFAMDKSDRAKEWVAG